MNASPDCARDLRAAGVGAAAVVCAALTAALLPARAPAGTTQPAGRSFRMGFTPFPHDMTLEALAAVDKLVKGNADVVAAHFEGVPWAEARTGGAFHREILSNWTRHKNARPAGGKLYLALTPINNDRSALAAYRREREGLPLPEAFSGKGFDSPVVMDAYLRYCRRAVGFLRPDYLAIGIEVNELYHKAPKKWPAYVRLHAHVYKHLKREHPDLPVFASFTLHNMLNPGWADRRAMLAAFRRLMPHNDMVAVSFYPFMASLTAKVDGSLAWLAREFDAFGKPYAFVETGEIAEPLVLKTFKLRLAGSEKTQRRALAALLEFAQARRTEFIIWFVPRDYDALWERIRGTAPEFFTAWRDCGLLDGAGRPRAAMELWRKAYRLPHRPERRPADKPGPRTRASRRP
jgi:hypothetical protein